MRFFPILAALLVGGLLYLAIAERPWLKQTFGMAPADATLTPDPDQESVKATRAAADAEGKTRVKVVVKRVIAKDIGSAVVLRGQTAAARQVDVQAETTAVVISEPLRKGSRVEEGQEMCVLDVGTRGAALEETRARLSEAESRVPEAEARVQEAIARLDEALINQNASAKLKEGGFGSTARLAGADAAVAGARSGIVSAESGLRAARSGIQAATAAVAVAEAEIDRLTIEAPFGGLLESDTAELGSLLQPGALCGTIIQLDPVKLVGFVPETEVNRVFVGAAAEARLAAGGEVVYGTVTFLSRSSDPTTRTFRTEINVPNTDLHIRDGQTAEILISAPGSAAHLIPQSALTLDDNGTLGVRLVDDAAMVSFAPVTIMRDVAEGIWVTGLPETADVIVVGQEYVVAGVTVAPTWQEVSQ
ncbi:efflux RND transporter periplasmic adaptor subunit [Sulfitobacter sp. SK012]|uniref:efflux RND transporter periplasmic adaptor subunit n=1 Tax=Sulfitobacter sp. SK012 TaxID=1389005 RepID=UPI000E0C708F|nr:efflux RND transporter periplasmic adaptor subunit [Sulfitobacter sp. SK012]AXI47265.1 efflux RND transporter periplasmic adaptor subunit [Sulfitobacter sp. SK012]